MPRESFSLGLNGQISRQTTIAFNVNMDRSLSPAFSGSPWITRSTVRRHAHAADRIGLPGRQRRSSTDVSRRARHRNDQRLRVRGLERERGAGCRRESARRDSRCGSGRAHSTTGRDGQFSFLQRAGRHPRVGLDTGALPIDFDPPVVAADSDRAVARRHQAGRVRADPARLRSTGASFATPTGTARRIRMKSRSTARS